MSVTLPSKILSAVVGKKIQMYKPSCGEIPKKKQSWSISPKPPKGLILNENTGSISGKCDVKYTKKHKLTVKGDGSTYSAEFEISILRPLPIHIQSLVSQFANDGTSLGHGVCEFIDNSIDANAKNIRIKMGFEEFEGGSTRRPWVIVTDDGKGISGPDGDVSVDSLELAMGVSTTPDSAHETWRLGAFGVGLPAAALTNAYYCTVFTRSGGKSAIGHMSHKDMKETKQLRFHDLEDIPQFLTKTKSFEVAKKDFDKMSRGTVILLQDVFKIRAILRDKQTQLNFQVYKNNFVKIKEQLTDYLRLIYHHFLSFEGAELRDSDGGVIMRKISIHLTGKLTPLDPLMLHNDSKKYGKKGTHVHDFKDAECKIEGAGKFFHLKMAVIPGDKKNGGMGRITPDGVNFDKAMSNAMSMYQAAGVIGKSKPGPPDAQGLYLYRNYRLIEFMTWKDIYAKSMAGTTTARCAVYTPQGLPVYNPSLDILNDFAVDQRKRHMHCSGEVIETIETVIRKPRIWFEQKGEKAHPLRTRADERKKYDGQKKPHGPGVDVPKKAVMEPSQVGTQEIPFSKVFRVLAPEVKKGSTTKWLITGPGGLKKEGTGTEFPVTLEKPGEHKILLTIISDKKKTHQHSQKFTLEEPEEEEGDEEEEGPDNWEVEKKKSTATKPPIFVQGKKFILNPDNPEYDSVMDQIESQR